MVTCGILAALGEMGKKAVSFKCGPDYIDPMFHRKAVGTDAWNLDPFLTAASALRSLLARHAKDADLAVIEGVMGYYDGLGGTTAKASAYELCSITGTPAVLIVDAKGMSTSVLAQIHGFLSWKKDSGIRGVLLNRISPMLYPRMKQLIEERLDIPVAGYVPEVPDCVFKSRHLGLVMPDEIKDIKEKLHRLAGIMRETIDWDTLFRIAQGASFLEAEDETDSFENTSFSKVRIGLAKDLDGLIFYGGYPELYGMELEENHVMRRETASAVSSGLPCMAECGGFLYLHREMEDKDGIFREMAGVIPAKAYKEDRLSRFGYISLRQNSGSLFGTSPAELTAHEFHYYDSDCCGQDFYAKKPVGNRGWECIYASDTLFAGFPHFYYYGCPELPKAFLRKCRQYQTEKRR